MTDNVVSIEKNLPKVVLEAICLKCLKRDLHIASHSNPLKEWICENCGQKGFIIATGQWEYEADDTLAKLVDDGILVKLDDEQGDEE